MLKNIHGEEGKLSGDWLKGLSVITSDYEQQSQSWEISKKDLKNRGWTSEGKIAIGGELCLLVCLLEASQGG